MAAFDRRKAAPAKTVSAPPLVAKKKTQIEEIVANATTPIELPVPYQGPDCEDPSHPTAWQRAKTAAKANSARRRK